jgi:hypothetical protein
MNFGFPRWLRLLWWGGLLILLASFLGYGRVQALAAGEATPFDVVAFLALLALLLAPLVAEVNVFGLALKAEVEKLKTNVRTDLASLKAEITTALDVRNTFSPVIQFPAPASDSVLNALESRVVKALNAALDAREVEAPLAAPTETQTLFGVRFNIERELRRIAEARDLGSFRGRPMPITQLTALLVEHGILTPDLGSAVREAYLITSRAIHAEHVTDSQRGFVKEVAPSLIAALRQIA